MTKNQRIKFFGASELRKRETDQHKKS